MADVAQLGIKITTDGIAKATSDLDRLEKQGKKTESSTKDIGVAAKNNVSSFKAMKGSTTQLSYQLQDIAVQAQMGTSAFTILGQQGPQIASIFGPGGAVVGALVAFGALVGGVIFNSVGALDDSIKELADDVDELAGKYHELTAAQRTYLQVLLSEKMENNLDIMTRTKAKIDQLNKTLQAQAFYMGSKTVEKYGLELLKLESDYDTAAAANERYTAILLGTDPVVQKAIDSSDDYVEKLSDEYIQLTLTGDALLEYKAIKAGVTAETLAGVIALQQEIDAIKAANAAKQEVIQAEERLAAFFVTANEKKAAADIKAKADELKREEDLFASIKILNDQKIAEDKRVADASDQLKQFTIASAANVVGQLSAIAEQGSAEAKILFGMQKALAIAQIIVSTEVAAQAAAAQAAILGGPPAWFATQGMIRALGYASAGIVAGTAIAGGRALGGQVREGQSYLVGERGPELLTMGTSGRIATNENLKKAVGSETVSGVGSVSVNFTIQANDTKGFDQLLNSRRGQIVSMINQAVNDRGRPSLA